MKLNREALLKTLKQLRPAVGADNPLESLQYIWFDQARDVAYAYNDVVGIEVPFQGEIDGGVGLALMGLLEHSSREEIELVAKDNQLLLTAGSSKGKLPLMPPAKAVHPFPPDDEERIAIVPLTKEAVAALRHVMPIAAGSGVTVSPEENELMFYSTDARSVAWAGCTLPEDYNAPRLLLSPDFCERLLGLLEQGDAVLEVLKDRVIAVVETNVRLIGRLLEQEKPLDFASRIAAAVPQIDTLALPEGLAEAFERVLVLAGGKVPKVQMEFGPKELKFSFQGDLGEISERFSLGTTVPAISVAFDGACVGRGIPQANGFVIGQRAFVLFTEAGFGYAAAAVR